MHIISDTHFEFMTQREGDNLFENFEGIQKDNYSDLLIIAGDFCQIHHHEKLFPSLMARICSLYKKVIYVPGNHEYYGISIPKGNLFLKSLELNPNCSNLSVLLNESCQYNGQRFWGGAMWFPDTNQPSHVKRFMSDFSYIRKSEPDIYKEHADFLLKVIPNMNNDDIVVTHHMPLKESIDEMFKDSELNPFFCAYIQDYLNEENLPKMLIHGHTHFGFDYKYDVGKSQCHVYCNPHGYVNSGENATFLAKIDPLWTEEDEDPDYGF